MIIRIALTFFLCLLISAVIASGRNFDELLISGNALTLNSNLLRQHPNYEELDSVFREEECGYGYGIWDSLITQHG